MNGCKNFQKSRPGFEKWTFLKMSKIENLKYFSEFFNANRLVTRMLLFSFFSCFFCDDNFFIFF